MAFYNNKLELLKLPKNLEYLGMDVFKGNNLKELEVPPLKIPVEVYNPGMHPEAFSKIEKLKLGEGTKKFPYLLFTNNLKNNLTKVKLPDNMEAFDKVEIEKPEGLTPFDGIPLLFEVYERNDKTGGTYVKKNGEWEKQKKKII